MTKLFNAINSGSSFASDTLGAHISVIHKEGKEPTACGSYRPISLLNVNLKLFTKILATRLAQHLQKLVHLDQVGFIPSREVRDSTTRVLNLLHVAQSTNTPYVFLNTDAEKAFDRIGCPLSPLLFVLSLEPFLSTVRLHPDIQGVTVGKTQHKISAFADDLIFSLTNPIVSLRTSLDNLRFLELYLT